MHSSTSNSDTACARRGIRLFLLLLALSGLVLELSARYGVPLVYRNMRRFQTDTSIRDRCAAFIREQSSQPQRTEAHARALQQRSASHRRTSNVSRII